MAFSLTPCNFFSCLPFKKSFNNQKICFCYPNISRPSNSNLVHPSNLNGGHLKTEFWPFFSILFLSSPGSQHARRKHFLNLCKLIVLWCCQWISLLPVSLFNIVFCFILTLLLSSMLSSWKCNLETNNCCFCILFPPKQGMRGAPVSGSSYIAPLWWKSRTLFLSRKPLEWLTSPPPPTPLPRTLWTISTSRTQFESLWFIWYSDGIDSTLYQPCSRKAGWSVNDVNLSKDLDWCSPV